MSRASDWLIAHGYTQFRDGTWSFDGYEASVEGVLTEFMEFESPRIVRGKEPPLVHLEGWRSDGQMSR